MTTNEQYLNSWTEFIKSSAPYAYHLSLTFKYDVSKPEAYSALNFLLHLLNAKLFGKSYKKRCLHLKGFAVCEMQARDVPHFHLLVKQDDVFSAQDKPSLKDHLLSAIKKVKKTTRSTGQSTYQLMHSQGVCLREVTSDSIVDYLLKTMRAKEDSFIGMLSLEGVTSI